MLDFKRAEISFMSGDLIGWERRFIKYLKIIICHNNQLAIKQLGEIHQGAYNSTPIQYIIDII